MILANENFIFEMFDITNSQDFDEIIILLILIYYHNFLKWKNYSNKVSKN